MLKEEGFRAFYKGGAVNAICTPAARGLYMGGHGLSQQIIGKVRGR